MSRASCQSAQGFGQFLIIHRAGTGLQCRHDAFGQPGRTWRRGERRGRLRENAKGQLGPAAEVTARHFFEFGGLVAQAGGPGRAVGEYDQPVDIAAHPCEVTPHLLVQDLGEGPAKLGKCLCMTVNFGKCRPGRALVQPAEASLWSFGH